MSLKSPPKTAAVLVAAGRGERAGQEDGPKQYNNLGGKAVLHRTLLPFLAHDAVDHVICVIHENDHQLYLEARPDHQKLLEPVTGGATRQLSVLAGLNALSNLGVKNVIIHDAARPFVDAALITRVLDGLADNPACLPALAVSDTLKRSDANLQVTETVSRDNLFRAQTPQGFDFPTILDAHTKADRHGLRDFTDDAALAEWASIPVIIVEGSALNTKLTTRDDILQARKKFDKMVPDVRVGHGYDTHQLVEGDSVWLCGVEIPHTHALSGHSDADIGLHALTDALLATIADGDIGSHFPPSDPRWKGAKSDQFLKHAVTRVASKGGVITHMDVTLVCEAPKIGPHGDKMRATIAEITGIAMSRVSVKATTNETIGFVGRNEGMVALATATVVMGEIE